MKLTCRGTVQLHHATPFNHAPIDVEIDPAIAAPTYSREDEYREAADQCPVCQLRADMLERIHALEQRVDDLTAEAIAHAKLGPMLQWWEASVAVDASLSVDPEDSVHAHPGNV